jgi:hypothetical protein
MVNFPVQDTSIEMQSSLNALLITNKETEQEEPPVSISMLHVRAHTHSEREKEIEIEIEIQIELDRDRERERERDPCMSGHIKLEDLFRGRHACDDE